jgi:hypothetical protein
MTRTPPDRSAVELVPAPRSGERSAGHLLDPSPWVDDPHPALAAADLATTLRAATGLRRLAASVKESGELLSPAGLSEWRSGKSVPYLKDHTRRSLLSLERFLPVRPGALLAAAERSRPNDTWEAPPQPRYASGRAGELRARLDAEGFTNRGRLSLVHMREIHTVEERRPVHSIVSIRLLALRPGVRRYVVVFAVDNRGPVAVRPGPGCRLGAQHTVGRGRRYTTLVTELVFDRALDAYDLYDLDFDLVAAVAPVDDRLPMPGCVRLVPDPGCRLLETRLRFGGELPKRVWRVTTWDVGRPTPRPVEEQPLGDGPYGLALTNPRTGPVGCRWRWPGAMEETTRVPAVDR